MKKSFVMLSLLCLAAIAGMVFFWVSLSRDKVDVRLNEIVLYGDPGEAENLAFTLQANFYGFGEVLWKTEHILGGENRSKTECTADFFWNMSSKSDEEVLEEQEDYFELYWGYEGLVKNDGYIDKLIKENNISGYFSKTFWLRDEYDYYPLRIELSLDDLKRDSDHPATEEQEKMIRQLEQKLASYFHMPVDEEELRVLLVTDDKGKPTTNELRGSNTLDDIISSQCIVADQAVWFTFSIYYNDVLDQKAEQCLSNLPKGAGVYRLPYQIREGIPYFDADQLEQVYAIPADTSLGEYVVDQNAHRILIHTKKAGKQYITVLSSETGACVQEIPLESLSGDEEDRVSLQHKEGVVLAYSFYGGRLIVLEQTEGNYRISLDVINAVDELPYGWDFAWNGHKLAMFAEDGPGVHYIYVYGRDGLLYEGKYWESLVLEEKKQNSGYSVVKYDSDAPINLQWR